MTNKDPAYVLGHSDRELSRLRAQARLLESHTRQFLLAAGIGPGMRVLDVGSGAGDVAFLAAEIVGPTGQVTGTDKAAAAVAAATLAAGERRLANVSFRTGDPAELAFDLPFDAIVGRYVLLYQADRAAMLRKLAAHLRAGGVLVFHEPDWVAARSIPPVSLYDACCGWISEAFRRAGTDSNMAGSLYAAFLGAGLRPPSMRMQTFIGGAAGSGDYLRSVADLVGTLLPAIERYGLATEAEVGIASLADRLVREAGAAGGVIVGRSEIAAWTRV